MVKNPKDREYVIRKTLVEDKKGDIEIEGKKYNLKISGARKKKLSANTAQAQKHLKETNNTVFGNKKVKAKTPYSEALRKSKKGWEIIHYERDSQTSLIKMCNTIIDLAKNRSMALVTFRFIEPIMEYVNEQGKKDIQYDSIFRSYSLTGKTAGELYDLVVKSLTTKSEGSDPVSSDNDLDTTFFKLAYREIKGNSKVNRTDGKSIKTRYFNTISFNSKEGDCLLAIINNGKKLDVIRKDLELPDGGININQIPILEDYFKININIYDNDIDIKRVEIDTDKENKTVSTFEYILLHRSSKKYKETYDILLYNNHFSLIKKYLPVVFDPICGELLKNSERDKKRQIKLTKEEIQKSLERYGRPIVNKNIKKKVDYDEYIIFWDIETVFNKRNLNLLEPYSVAWLEVKRSELKNCDFSKMKDKVHFTKGINCMKKFIEWIDENDDSKKYHLVGYNNARFDNFPLVKELANNDILRNVMFVNNSLLKVFFSGRHETFDLVRFTMCSLDTACRDFKTNPKKLEGFSHYLPQDAFNKKGWTGLIKWLDTNKDKIENYNKTDVLATADLFRIVSKEFLRLTGKDILKFPTLASLAYKCFDETNKKDCENLEEIANDMLSGKNRLSHCVKSQKLDELIRDSFTGGRCQKFNKKNRNFNNRMDEKFKVNDHLFMFDVKSLYPYVMMNRYYPIGECKYTSKYRTDKLGIYHIKIIKQPFMKIIPNRDKKKKSLDWEFDGEITKRLTSVEIECLKRHGATIEFLPWIKNSKTIGIYWDKYSDTLFNKFFEPLKAEKTKQDELCAKGHKDYNPALRNICKLLLNSLSGKMGQRNFETQSELCKTIKDEDRLLKKSKDGLLKPEFWCGDFTICTINKMNSLIYKNNSKPSQLCAFIYAWSRVYMYDLIFSKYDVIYTDTDSALLKKKDGEDFIEKFIQKKGTKPHIYHDLSDEKGIPVMGGDFGQFEEELGIKEDDNVETYILAKKLYAIEIRDKDGHIKLKDKSKYRMKGINFKRDILISKEIANIIKNKGPNFAYEYYKCMEDHPSKNFLKLHPFRTILTVGKCYYLTSQLKREEFNIKQLYSIKKLDIRENNLNKKETAIS